MKKETNLESVKSIAISFLYQPVEETEYSPIVVSHPIFESGITGINKDGDMKMVNILESDEDLKCLIKMYRDRIMGSESAREVYSIIRKSYRLTFLKYVLDYLSANDMSELLCHAWTTSENPNDDTNVSLSTIIKWFNKADKKILMDDEEYNVYCSLPDTFIVYRGVGVTRKPDGLSWTRNRKTAEWFANRFNIEGKRGFVQAATVNREDVLAYFNSRGEDEIVISVDKKNVSIA